MNTAVKTHIIPKLENLSEESAAYLLSVFALVILLLAKLLWPAPYPEILSYIPFVGLIYGFMSFVTQEMRILWKSALGKIIVSTLLLLGSSVSLAFAKILINTSLMIPSDAFPITQSIITILIAPLTASIMFGFLGIILLPLGMLISFIPFRIISAQGLLVFWQQRDEEPVGVLHGCARFSALIVILSLCWTFNGNNGWYTDQLTSFSEWFAYNLEAEAHTYCEVSENERVAYLSDGMIVVAKQTEEGNYVFDTSKCIK